MTKNRDDKTSNTGSDFITKLLFPIIALGIAVLVIEEILNDMNTAVRRIMLYRPYNFIRSLFSNDDNKEE